METSSRIVVYKHHLEIQYQQGSLEEHKLHLQPHQGDPHLLEELRLHLHMIHMVNRIVIIPERMHRPTILTPTKEKVRNPAKRSQHRRHHLILVHQQEDMWYPAQTSSQEILALVDLQFSV